MKARLRHIESRIRRSETQTELFWGHNRKNRVKVMSWEFSKMVKYTNLGLRINSTF